jgi:thiol-disulfide isomerase/thioredoxin
MQYPAVALVAALALTSGCAGRLNDDGPGSRPAGTATAATPRRTGDPAPPGRSPPRAPRALMDVPLTTAAGNSVRMADLRRQVTVIAVWATWCKPCLQELPLLDAVRRRYADDPKVSVVAVSIDEVDSAEELGKVQATVDHLGLKLPVYVDQTGKLANHLMGAIRSVPLLAILDGDLHMLRERGFDVSTSESAYIAEKSALIELARKGALPAPAPPTPADAETSVLVAALRANLKRAYPELSEERIEELLTDLEERMQLQNRRR